MKTKSIKKNTLVTAYDNCDKYTLLEWLKKLAKELEAKQLAITKANEGEGILLTFKEDGTLDKISADVTEADINSLASQIHDLEIEVDGKQTKLRAGQNITIYHDEQTGEDVISSTGGGGGVELLVKARYEGEGEYLVQTSGLYPFIYSFYGAERRLPNVVVEIFGSEKDGVIGETILFNSGDRVRYEQQDYTFTFYSRVENEDLDGYYKLVISPIASTMTKPKFNYKNDINELKTNKQNKTDNALTTESKQVVGAINEHDLKINTHNTRLNNIDNDIIQLESTKQNKSDNNLTTTSKNVVGAINEVNAKAEGSEHAYVISTANGKNPNFVSDAYDITATQIELQDGSIVLIADIKTGTDIYVLEEGVSDRWYSGDGHFIKLSGDKPILDDYQLKATLDDDVEDLGYLKSVSFSIITGSVSDNVALTNALLQKENKTDLDNDVRTLGYIKGITQDDLLELLEGSKFISIDEDEETEKLVISFDFTNIDEFITFASGQDIVASWTEGKELQLNINNTLKNKINNSLQLPTTHTEETLVGVDTTGGQEQVKIDSGTLEIVNGTLKAKIPAQEQANWSETDTTKPSYIKNKPTIPTIPHLYEHTILIHFTQIQGAQTLYFSVWFKTINDKSYSMTLTEVKTLLNNNLHCAFYNSDLGSYPSSERLIGGLRVSGNDYVINGTADTPSSESIASDTIRQII